MPDLYSDSDIDTDIWLSEQQSEPRAIGGLELIHELSQAASLPTDRFSYHTHQLASSSSTSQGHQENLTLDDGNDNQTAGRTTLPKREHTSISGSSAHVAPKGQAGTSTKKQRTLTDKPSISLTRIVKLIDSAEQDFKRFNTQKAKDTLDTVSTLLRDVSHATSATMMACFRYCILFSEIYHDLGQIDIAQQHVAQARSFLMQPVFVMSDYQRRLSKTALIIQQSALSMSESTSVVIQKDIIDVTKKPLVIALLESALVKLDKLGISEHDPLRANVLLHLGCACFSVGFIEDGIRYWKQLCAIPRFDANEYKRLSNIIKACQLLLELQQGKQFTVNYLETAKTWVAQYLPNFYHAVFLGQISLSLAYALLNETNVYEDAQKEASHAISIFAEACFSASHPLARRSKRIYITIEWLKTIAEVKDGQFILFDQTLDSETCSALADAFISPHCHIDKLWIKSCHIDYDDLISLLKVFNDPRCHMTEFILENHDVKKRDKQYELKNDNIDDSLEDNRQVELFNALIRSNLIKLSLHGCALDQGDLALIEQELLGNSGRMTTLSLNDNNIGFDGAISFAKTLLRENCKLIQLDLGNNHIDDRGIWALAKALMHENCKLTHLGLAGNYIGSFGIKALAEALMSPHCQLTMLDLRNMQLNDECLQALFSAIAHPNCKLVHLKIGGISPLTKLTKASLIALLDALKHPHCKLASLELTCPAAFEQDMVAAIALNDSLTKVSGLNDFSLPARQQIEAYCMRNRRNLTQKNTSLAQHLGHWATFFDSRVHADVSATLKHSLADDEPQVAETHAANVPGLSACGLDP